MAGQDDLALVQGAIRLGWSISELRGRYRTQLDDLLSFLVADPQYELKKGNFASFLGR